MSAEISFEAADPKGGLTLEELEQAVETVYQLGKGRRYRLKATVGFKQQLTKIRFVEVEDVPAH